MLVDLNAIEIYMIQQVCKDFLTKNLFAKERRRIFKSINDKADQAWDNIFVNRFRCANDNESVII